jgi:hypothetical protein
MRVASIVLVTSVLCVPVLWCLTGSVDLAAAPATAAAGKYFFVDASATDPSFAAFRKTLLHAATARDGRALRAALAPTVEANLNNVRQPAGHIIGMYFPAKPAAGELWDELRIALTLGAIPRDGGYCAASIGCDGKLKVDDLAVIGDDVPLFKLPETTAKVLERMSHDIVRAGQTSSGEVIETTEHGKTYEFLRILSPVGRTGYVESRYIRGPMDHRFYFKKYQGAWKLDAFSSGP